MTTQTQVCVISYNSRGFSGLHQDFIKNLVSTQTVGDKIPILCNQENFILRGNSYKINQTLPNFHILFNPAVKASLDRGRPRGGLFIAIPNSIKGQVTDVSPGHWRVQAVLVASPSSSTLLVNTYFPCDSRQALGAQNEVIEVLELVKRLIETSACNSVVWCGDINADFKRNTGQVALVRDTLTELRLDSMWEKFSVDFTCAHEINEENMATSTIDHFFCSSEISDLVSDAGVLHSPDNKSDHSPVYCIFSNFTIKLDITDARVKHPKPSWKSSTEEQRTHYEFELEHKLGSISIPPCVLECRDIKCRRLDHCDSVDRLAVDVLEAVQAVAEECLPCPVTSAGRRGGQRALPGWNDSVKPFKDTAYFWHQIWISCGKPVNTEVHRIMKRARNVYHYQLRKIRKSEEIIKKNNLLDACLNGEGDIFREIKSLRKTKKAVANSIDGVKEDDIPDHFRDIYSGLYNSVEDVENIAIVSAKVEQRIGDYSIDDVTRVTPSIVKEATGRIKSGKTDPVFSFSSDCIKVDSERLAFLLSIIIQCFLVHGHVTRFLLLATLVPIIKDKLGSINSSKNYRSIAISSLILKLMDWIILILFGSALGLHDLQFAYQPGVSGNMCTYAVLETIDYFLRHNSEVFMCTMDMTKAFDMTVHSTLFSKMLKAGLSPVFLRLMIFIYREQFANVRWNGEVSSVFTLLNGVRQGAVLSALAYCFYCEELFTLLEQQRSGCWVNGFYLGLLGYSDDNICLAPSLSALQSMLDTCQEYAANHNLKFSTDPNPSKCKTKTMAFLKSERRLPNLTLCGNPLPWTDKCKHLGTIITNKIDGCEEDMRIKNAIYIEKNSELNQEFHFAHPVTRLKVNQIYNSHYSSSPLWNLFGVGARRIETSYNRSVKIMLDLPYGTHRYLIEPLTSAMHVKRVLINRFLGFMENISKSEKKAIKMLMETSKRDARSVTGRNYREIMILLGKTSIENVRKGDGENVEYFKIREADTWRVEMIEELINLKHQALDIENFSGEELDYMLTYICTS